MGSKGPIHLDTSFLIRALVRGSTEAQRILRWLEDGHPLVMSTLAWCEFLCGPIDRDTARLAHRVVRAHAVISLADADLGSVLFNATGRRRGTLADCLIAANAIGADAPLATSNSRDFDHFKKHGLRLLH